MQELWFTTNVRVPSKKSFLSCQNPTVMTVYILHHCKWDTQTVAECPGYIILCVRGSSRFWTKANAKQATNDTFIRVRDAAPECRPLSQLLWVTELDTSHRRQILTHKRGTVCHLSIIFSMTNEAGCVHVEKREVQLHQPGAQNDSLSGSACSLQDTILSQWIHKENRNPSLAALSSGSPVNPHSTNVCSTAAAFQAPKNRRAPTS